MIEALPKPIADYVAASNAHAPDAVAACFAEDAVVFDENREHSGRTAIRIWVAEAGRLYRPTLEISGFTQSGETAVLTGRVSGTFPGSPVVLRFIFTLRGEEIVRLMIEV
ncbi:MAG: nuclear transport factor 2 family protein [Desulfovibrionaceae bacterium]|nr:nuclear transport factor 2 family protein [Desulfovibrionaceae bacterium]